MNPNNISQLEGINREALDEIKRRADEMFSVDRYMLFGSAVRGDTDAESDIDLLILTTNPLTLRQRHEITDIVFDVNLAHDTNYSTTVIDTDSWENGIVSVLPFHTEVERDGIIV